MIKYNGKIFSAYISSDILIETREIILKELKENGWNIRIVKPKDDECCFIDSRDKWIFNKN
jgi:hypothetical protein